MSRSALFIGPVWPETDASAAGLRVQGLVDAFRGAGWRASFASAAKDGPHRARLEREGVETRSVRANDPAFDAWIRELAPEVVVFDRFTTEEQFGWRVRAHSPESLRVLDTDDLHFLRRARGRALERGESLAAIADCAFGLEEIAGEDLPRELAAIYRSDLTLLISDFEERLLTERLGVPHGLLHLCRLFYPPPHARDWAGFGARRDFVSIGNFRHPPNADSVLWLKREIWPILRRLARERGLDPLPELHVYGAYPAREMMELSSESEGFRVMGPARDQYETLARYRVSLAPLRFGAGIKGKISDSWWCGTPAVATPLAAEGMSAGLPWGGAIAPDAGELARRALALYSEPDAWLEARERGRRIVEELYGTEAASGRLLQAVEAALAGRRERRRRNAVGAVLWHQSHRSTEYFSRWIELKESLTRVE